MNIFDIDKIDDLPRELRDELHLTGGIGKTLLQLFAEAQDLPKARDTLNLNELLVSFYRRYKVSKTRLYMMAACHRLVKQGLLTATGRKGEYQITEKGKTIT